MNTILNKNIDNLTISQMKTFLRDIGAYFSLKNKDEYIKRVKLYKNMLNFPWRDDQKQFIDTFLEFRHKIYILHAVFGAGKTTTLMGCLIIGIINGLFEPEDALFISFNISIKNEIKRKLKDYGLMSKINVRTFDSIIYELAKVGGYPHMDLPNFEGKRKFVYELIFNKCEHIPSYQPKLILLDEAQDLERSTVEILQYFYPNSKFIFVGDIFQSIQKEARESILWHYMMLPENPDVYKMYMYITPRVPSKNLETLKKGLKIHYPEFSDKIDTWRSGNTTSNADIEWKRFHSYTHIYSELTEFLSKHPEKDSMIITFSSAITVKGAMGDIARFRRFLSEGGFDVNCNHKKQDSDKLFLSTAHSSKGLERDYVIIFLTFPLERAFVHFSDDIVVNLLTVALSRAKKKVIMYVPSHEDKYTRCLSLFEKCPTPNKEKIREGKILKEFTFSDYIDLEHSPTEIIRAGVIKYDTRIDLKKFTKKFNFSKIFNEDIPSKLMPISTEEEKCFVGVLIENLITSTWISRWPEPHTHDVQKHPFYSHIIARINNSEKKYRKFISSNMFNTDNQFDGIYLYSQIHIALSNKIFMKLSDGLISNLKKYWHGLKPKALLMKPNDGGKLKIQPNLRMPYVAGIADAMTEDDDEKTTSIYEIKASQDRNWVDNALTQIIMYGLMTGKTWLRLHLLNPFQNSKESYYFDTKKILHLRQELTKDVLAWNLNCFMSKTYPDCKDNEKLEITKSGTVFMNVIKDASDNITQISLVDMISPIKCRYIYSKCVSSNNKKEKTMSKEERFACESELSKEDLIKEVTEILNSEIHKKKTVWSLDKYNNIKDNIQSVKEKYSDIKNFDNIVEYLGYKKNDDLPYSADLRDSLTQNIFTIAYMFKKNRFI
jgi:hypothetical protein